MRSKARAQSAAQASRFSKFHAQHGLLTMQGSDLRGKNILIVADVPVVSMDLSFAVKDLGGAVVGPAGTIQEALHLLASEGVSGVIIDLNRFDSHVCPLLDGFVGKHVPVIVRTASALPPDICAQHPSLLVFLKPTAAARLVNEIATAICAG